MNADDDFPKLLTACVQLSQMFDEGLVYIGGIAVYMHAINAKDAEVREFAEATHDGDFYISLADMADLRDIEEVVPNRRLSKSQIIKDGFAFDIYTERQSDLIVPYDEVLAHSVVLGDVRVASMGHLLALKLEAFRDRKASAKGAKDARDIIRLAAIADRSGTKFEAHLVAPYLSERHFELLDVVRKSPEATALAKGNAVRAKRLRASVERMFSSVEKAASEDEEPRGAAEPKPRG